MDKLNDLVGFSGAGLPNSAGTVFCFCCFSGGWQTVEFLYVSVKWISVPILCYGT